MKKYIIYNPFTERKYWLGTFWGIMLALVAVIMDKYGFHVWLTKVMVAIGPSLAGMERPMVDIGHYLYKAATCIGIMLMFACVAPLAMSYVARITDAMKSGKEE